MNLNTPILFVVFNREYETKITFNHIRLVKPKKLYISMDGPRHENLYDIQAQKKIKKIIENIDWNCEVKYNYSDINLGAGKGVLKAINWFFENENEGMIIEDDCVPSLSFFYFIEAMLDKYRNVNNIMAITGTNIATKSITYSSDYVYSIFPIMWGWATWKNRWDKYDFEMTNWENQKKTFFSYSKNSIKKHPVFFELFNSTYNNVKTNNISVWDHQWIYCNFINNGLTITPTKNLVNNIGFGENATHSNGDVLQRGVMGSHILFPPYNPPSSIQNDEKTDKYIAVNWFTATYIYFLKIKILSNPTIYKIWKKIKN